MIMISHDYQINVRRTIRTCQQCWTHSMGNKSIPTVPNEKVGIDWQRWKNNIFVWCNYYCYIVLFGADQSSCFRCYQKEAFIMGAHFFKSICKEWRHSLLHCGLATEENFYRKSMTCDRSNKWTKESYHQIE